MRWLCLVLVLVAVAGAQERGELGGPSTAARGEHVALRLGDLGLDPRGATVRVGRSEAEVVSRNDHVLVFAVPLELEESDYPLVVEDALGNQLSGELAVRGEVIAGTLFVVLTNLETNLGAGLDRALELLEEVEGGIFEGLSDGFRLADGAEPRRLIVPIEHGAEHGEAEVAERWRENLEHLRDHGSICSEEEGLALVDVGGAPLEEAVAALRQVGFLTDKLSVGHSGAGGEGAQSDKEQEEERVPASSAFGGRSITIAVLDTGVSPHADFGTRLLAHSGYDIVTDSPDSSDRSPAEHGTTVARLAANAAPEALVLPVRVCDEAGRCLASDVLLGICHALARAPQGPEGLVINLSLGGAVPVEPLKVVLEHAARELGTLVAMSAGNKGAGGPRHYPAAYSQGVEQPDGLVAVSALIGETGAWASWDGGTRGNYIDLAAPGAAPNGEVGTSFATGYAAGVLALWRDSLPTVSAADVERALLGAARLDQVICPAGPCADDEVGAGAISLP